MKWLRRLWPKRMAHQLGLQLLLALLACNVIAMLYLQRTGALLHPLSRTLALERLITAYHAAEGLAPEDASRLLAAMQTKDAHFWVASQRVADADDMRPEEHRLIADLNKRLRLPPDTGIGMQLERTSGANAREWVFSASGWSPLRLRTSIDLHNGLYLNAIQHPAGGYEWTRILSYSLPVSSLPILLIVFFCMRRVVQPVKRLAQATERVSRGEWIAPLPLYGPQEARELTLAFNVMQERIARHVEGRTRMLAAISHDLNTPITELRLQIELLDDSPEREDMLDSLGELQAMVRETLSFVRGDAVQEDTVRISLSDLLDDLARRYASMGQAIGWQRGTEIFCHCRPLALKRALTNLIDNALRHAGDALLSAQVTAQGEIVVEILDHGPGIEQAWLTQVFEPFVQLDQRGTEHSQGGGLGLGLAIARSCIQAHGGELSLENRPPAGLCALVRLPGEPVL